MPESGYPICGQSSACYQRELDESNPHPHTDVYLKDFLPFTPVSVLQFRPKRPQVFKADLGINFRVFPSLIFCSNCSTVLSSRWQVIS